MRLGPLENAEARGSLAALTVATGVNLVCLLSGSSLLPIPISPWISAGSIVVTMLTAGYFILVRLDRLLRWDRALSSIAAQKAGDLNDSLFFSLPCSSVVGGSTLPEHGWNLLVEAGRQYQALKQLEQSIAERLKATQSAVAPPLLDALSDGVAMVDSSGIVTYANSALTAICGVESSEALMGRPLTELIASDSETVARLKSAVQQSSIEWKFSSPNGTRTLNGRFRPGRRSDGASFSYVWTIRDVTQQRLADAMRDQFLTTATHEFRTPLANIRAYAESLQESNDLDSESRKRFYNVIQSESVRLSQLVDDLLDISRMQAGALSLDPAETDLGKLVEEITAKVQGEVQSKSLDFQCELPPKLPPKIVVDKSKIAAALVNLLGNATKYTPTGGKVIFRVELSPNKLQFQVSDTGIGIAPDELPHVFERFYRSNDDRVREHIGSGLGLALTQEVARLHGGEITVESQLDQGSTFCLSLPLDPLTSV